MSNGNCSFCGKGLSEASEWRFDYDVSLECSECKNKINWFVSGLLVGIFAASMIFYLLYNCMS